MNTQSQNQKRTVRNLAIFAVVVVAIGWLGAELDVLMQNPPSQRLGMLLWLTTPLAASLLLRAFAGDSWKDFGGRPSIKANGVWYAVSLLVYPVGTALTVLIGLALGQTTFPNFSLNTLGLVFQTFTLGLLPMFIKNIFEEFAWRGYLAPKVYSLGLTDYVGHLIVGLIWGAWHIPYYLFFLDRAIIQAYTALDLGPFMLLALVGILSASLVYGEIRLLTNSVWPPLLMHMVGNALVDPLVVQGFIKIVPGMDFLVSPGHHSILCILFFTVVGISLRQLRKSRQQSRVGPDFGDA